MDNGIIEFGESHRIDNPVSKVFAYDGQNVTFEKKGAIVMVNATEMAKPFKKVAKDWLRTKQTNEFIHSLSVVRHISPTELVVKSQGGTVQGTWMHEDVAIEFARWLAPEFAIWCNDRIKELLTVGMTATQPTLEAMLDNPDLVIGLATKLKQQREENARLVEANRKSQAVIAQQSEKILKDAPKVSYFEAFMRAAHGSKSVGIREVVKQAHIKSEKKFITWMLDRRILFRQKRDNRLQPYADYKACFDSIDVHDETNDWSGKQLLINPYGKMKIVKRYHEEQPMEFDSPMDLFSQNH